MVQRYAARFVKNNYWQISSVTAMGKELNWDTLESRMIHFHIRYVHKMLSNQVALNPFYYFERYMKHLRSRMKLSFEKARS